VTLAIVAPLGLLWAWPRGRPVDGGQPAA